MIGGANRGHTTSIWVGLWTGGAHLPRVRLCAVEMERRGGVGGIGKMGAHVQPTRIPQHSSSTETVVEGRMGGWESWRPVAVGQ